MENVLQTLLEKGSEVYLTMNCSGRLLHTNEATRRYLGLPDVHRNIVCMEDLILSESHGAAEEIILIGRSLPSGIRNPQSGQSLLACF